jgi:hypothetical protein
MSWTAVIAHQIGFVEKQGRFSAGQITRTLDE